jgi:hypothetical protein
MGGFILPLSQAKVKGVNLSCGVQLTTCLPVPCGVMVSLPHLGAHCLLTLSLSLSAPFLRSEDLKILCRLVMWKAEWSLRTFLKSRATLGHSMECSSCSLVQNASYFGESIYIYLWSLRAGVWHSVGSLSLEVKTLNILPGGNTTCASLCVASLHDNDGQIKYVF